MFKSRSWFKSIEFMALKNELNLILISIVFYATIQNFILSLIFFFSKLIDHRKRNYELKSSSFKKIKINHLEGVCIKRREIAHLILIQITCSYYLTLPTKIASYRTLEGSIQ